MKRALLAAVLAAAAAVAVAAPIYDEGVDAKAVIATTLADAKAAGKPVLVVFGANWCGDCKVLDMAFHRGATAALIEQQFRVVKVDVGRFDRNVAIAERYGVPLKQGIPTVAVLAPDGRVLHATRGGELADARKMGDAAIHDYFARIAAGAGLRP